jgi:hypothetical protein
MDACAKASRTQRASRAELGMLLSVEQKTPLAARPVFGGYPARVVEDWVDVEGLQEEGEEVREVPMVTQLHNGTGET